MTFSAVQNQFPFEAGKSNIEVAKDIGEYLFVERHFCVLRLILSDALPRRSEAQFNRKFFTSLGVMMFINRRRYFLKTR